MHFDALCPLLFVNLFLWEQAEHTGVDFPAIFPTERLTISL